MTGSLEFLKAAENRESFFRRIALIFPTLDPRYRLIERAYNDAKEAFRGVNREGGERYFEHIRAVALIVIDHLRVRDADVIMAALLHDIVEDRDDWTVARVQEAYGERVALLVEYLSKPSSSWGSRDERLHLYHSRFAEAPREFFVIKLADRWHNLLSLWECPLEKRLRKIAETKAHYLPHAEREILLVHELEAALGALEREG